MRDDVPTCVVAMPCAVPCVALLCTRTCSEVRGPAPGDPRPTTRARRPAPEDPRPATRARRPAPGDPHPTTRARRPAPAV
ncbi:hypothetical protein NHX12_002399 [Muraenolepis orangiensis]|uniref:Uncharacterized protein n=1 Tax=Muraenolepis orangiensis TaxID=630683 RepID=A0A9Q0IF88_9TELE|nr:hypothetical protein NHX12_002399 [Muraenolepis orangiensis]